MAQLQEHNHSEQINQLDEQFQSEQHLDPAKRLNQLSQAAKTQVNRVDPDGLTAWFESTDADAMASNPLHLDFWRSQENSKSREIVRKTRAQVMTVMENAGVSFSDGLSDEAYAPNLERMVWSEAQGSVLDMIDNTHQQGLSSLAVAEGYEKFLVEAKNKTDKEWQKQKAENQAEYEKYNWWTRNVYYWPGSAKRFEKFSPELEKQMGTMFASLEEQTKKIKINAQDRVSNMAERIEAIWESTVDPDLRADLWDEIVDTAEATDLGTVYLTNFGITEDQDKIDFTEALTRLDFVKNGLGISEESDNKFNQQEGLLRDAQAIETTISSPAYNYGKYKTLRGRNIFRGINRQETVEVSNAELVKILTEELQSQGVQVESWFSSMNGAQLHTDTSRLAVILQNIQESQIRSIEARQAYVNWFDKFDSDTSGGASELPATAAVRAEFDLVINGSGPSKSPNKHLEECLVTAKALDIKGSSEQDFKDFIDQVGLMSARSKRLFDQFEHKKASFPESDREQLEKIWARINAKVDEFKAVAPKWLADKQKYTIWEQQNASTAGAITQAENELLTSIGPLTSDFASALAGATWTGVPATLQTDLTNLESELTALTIGSPMLNGISTRLRNVLPVITQLPNTLRTSGSPNPTLDALVLALNTHQASITLKEQHYASAQAKVASRNNQAPTLSSDLDVIDVESERASIENIVRNLATITTNPYSSLPAADRYKMRMMKDFTKEVEASFLQRMEANDQYDLLSRSAEGTTVVVHHKIVAGVQSLAFPQQLGSPVTDTYRVARKISNQGVLLEKVGTNETITVLGATVKGGQPFKNAIVANSAASSTSAGGANAIITNMKIA